MCRTVSASSRIDDELAVLDVIAERRLAAHPHALLLGGCDLVANALAGDLTLELGEGQKDIERQPSHGAGGVELLGHRYEGDGILVEHLDDLGEVRQRAGQSIDLVDDHDVHLAGAHIRQQPLECRPLQGATRITAVVVYLGQKDPAFALLADDEGLACLALGVEGVEVLLQPFLAALAGVERATEFGLAAAIVDRASLSHGTPPTRPDARPSFETYRSLASD